MTSTEAALAAEIERIAMEWRGASGGIFTIHAMSLEMAKRLAGSAALRTARTDPAAWPHGSHFRLGDRVRKTKGSSWHGHVCGYYFTTLTPVGVAVESERERGSVQVYPQTALEAVPGVVEPARTDPGRGEADVAGLVEFLRVAERYFQSRPTNYEDTAYWANVYNAENCRKAADTIERLVRERGEAEAKATGVYKEGVAAGSLVTELIEKQRDVAYRQRDTAIRERDEARAVLTLFAKTEMVFVGSAHAIRPEDGKNADWFACFRGEQPTLASYARARAVLATTETDHGRG